MIKSVAIKLWTRVVIEVQETRMQKGIKNAVMRNKGRLIPSSPTLYSIGGEEIQETRSTNCMLEIPVSKAHQRGSAKMNTSRVQPNVSQRAALADTNQSVAA